MGISEFLRFLSPQKKNPVTSFGHREVWSEGKWSSSLWGGAFRIMLQMGNGGV